MQQHIKRRALLTGLTSLMATFGSKSATAQSCSVSGPSATDILNDILGGKSTPTFRVAVVRGPVVEFEGKLPNGSVAVEDGRIGQIFVNDTLIGDTVENEKLKIAPGDYKGVMRYVSGKNFVQGPFGVMGNSGDFLLEAAGVQGRTDILFHGGTKPWHSLGCILLAAVKKKTDSAGKTVRWIEDNNALRRLRLAYYGSDTPNACPNVAVSIVVS